MKYLVVIAAFIFSSNCLMAQSKDAMHHKGTRKTSRVKNKSTSTSPRTGKKQLPEGTAIRGGQLVPLHHGAHDYTPGSPVGTGGAGGNTMSGSPQGSASENAMGKKSSNELLKKNNGLQPNKNKKTGNAPVDSL